MGRQHILTLICFLVCLYFLVFKGKVQISSKRVILMPASMTTTWPTLFGLTMKKLRELKGISLTEMSDLTGISKSAWSRIEKGDTVANIEHIGLFCRAMNIDLIELMEHFSHMMKEFKNRDVDINETRQDDDVVKTDWVLGSAIAGSVMGAAAGALLTNFLNKK